MGTSLAEDVTCSRLSSEPGDCPPVCVLEEAGSGQLCQCLRPSADFTGEKTNPVSHQRDLRSPISFVSNQDDLLSSSLVATNSLTLQRQQLSWSPNAVHQVVLLLFCFTGIETADIPPSPSTPLSVHIHGDWEWWEEGGDQRERQSTISLFLLFSHCMQPQPGSSPSLRQIWPIIPILI